MLKMQETVETKMQLMVGMSMKSLTTNMEKQTEMFQKFMNTSGAGVNPRHFIDEKTLVDLSAKSAFSANTTTAATATTTAATATTTAATATTTTAPVVTTAPAVTTAPVVTTSTYAPPVADITHAAKQTFKPKFKGQGPLLYAKYVIKRRRPNLKKKNTI